MRNMRKDTWTFSSRKRTMRTTNRRAKFNASLASAIYIHVDATMHEEVNAYSMSREPRREVKERE